LNRPENHPTAIQVFAPWCEPEQEALRHRIHRARDIAQARAERSCHSRARTIYWLAAQLASDWVFARVPTFQLDEIVAALSRLFLVAGQIERLEAPDD